MVSSRRRYYVPEQSKWPFIGSLGLFLLALGAASVVQSKSYGPYLFLVSLVVMTIVLVGLFNNIINESQQALYSKLVDSSFKWGMLWFIFSEVMFFAVFFGALFYTRHLSVPWLAGLGEKAATNEFLWSGFVADWPLLVNPDPQKFIAPLDYIRAWPLPAINTLILLTSSVTITIAHHALLAGKQKAVCYWLLATAILGGIFLLVQFAEYHEAYTKFHLKLSSGIYGSTFFMLTGFHGAHVTIGTIMLLIILVRAGKQHFTPMRHFAFEATAWYWHFVDVVWLMLFVFVYILPLK